MSTIITTTGRFTGNLKTGTTQNNRPWARASVATNYRGVDEHGEWQDLGTQYWVVTAFGREADHLTSIHGKGTPVIVAGELTVHEYEAADGTTRIRHAIIATMIGTFPPPRKAQPTTPDDTQIPQAVTAEDMPDDIIQDVFDAIAEGTES